MSQKAHLGMHIENSLGPYKRIIIFELHALAQSEAGPGHNLL